ncbi:MAG: peptidoglycan DD-metalloendopeptidase family protein, partial [Candidatus Omnitrophica bacterium]|nr:peptidoglycan DD-metalloendopeptidase family protein [Candidatus Omnitrophota bacterium]
QKSVKASAEGKVVFLGYIKGWGETLMIQHTSSLYTIYANLDNVSVKEGSFTKKNDTIASVASGKNGNQILHFEIRKNCIPQNPLKYIN